MSGRSGALRRLGALLLVPAVVIVANPSWALAAAPSQAPAMTPFILRGVAFEGATLPEAVLGRTWRPYLGATIDAAGLGKISNAVIAAYQSSDVAIYTVVVPAQSFEGGILRVQVVEGYLEGLAIDPSVSPRYAALVQRRLSPLTRRRPLAKGDLQRAISLLRDTPGLNPTITLVSGSAPGATRLSVKLDPHPIQLSVGINNRGTTYLGRTQATADLYLNGLLAPEGQTRFTVVAPTDADRFVYYGVSHQQRVNEAGTQVQVYAAYLKTRPIGPLLIGHATSLGVQVSHPLQRSFTRDIYLTASLDAVDSDDAFLGRTFSNDAVRTLRTGVFVKATGARTTSTGSLTAATGIKGLDARTLAPGLTDLGFVKLSGLLGHTQTIGPASLRLNAAAQWTDDRLPASEYFTLGGRDFGRAYAAAALAGDRGYAGSAELAFAIPKLKQAELYTFVDGGSLTYIGRGGLATESARLSSAGLGARGAVLNRLGVELEAAKGLTNDQPYLKQAWRGIFTVRSVW